MKACIVLLKNLSSKYLKPQQSSQADQWGQTGCRLPNSSQSVPPAVGVPGHIPKWRYSGYQVWFVFALPHTVGIIFSEEKEQFGKARRSLKSKSQKHLEITWFKNTKKQKGSGLFSFLCQTSRVLSLELRISALFWTKIWPKLTLMVCLFFRKQNSLACLRWEESLPPHHSQEGQIFNNPYWSFSHDAFK